MASDGIKVRIDTEADTSGVDDAAAALDDLQQASEATAAGTDSLAAATQAEAKAQAQADVERAKALRTQREQAAVIKQIEANTRAMLAASAASEVAAIARQFRELGDTAAGASTALDSLSAGLTTFVATGNPVAAVAAAIGSSLGAAIKFAKEYRNETDLAAKAHDNAAAAARKFAESRARLAAQVGQERLADQFWEEASAQQDAVEAIERRNRVEAVRRETEASIAAATATKGPQAEADAAVTAAGNELAALDDRLRELAAQAQSAALAADQAKTALREAPADLDMEGIRDLELKVRETRAASEKAYADLEAEQEIAAMQGKAIATKADAAVRQIAEQAATDFGAMTENFGATLAAEVASQGAAATAASRQALANVRQVLSDSVIQQEEVAVLVTAVRQMANSSSEADRQIAANFDGLIASGNVYAARFRSQGAEISRLWQSIRDLQRNR